MGYRPWSCKELEYTHKKSGLLIIYCVVADVSLNSSLGLFLLDFGIMVMAALGSIAIKHLYFETSAESTESPDVFIVILITDSI